MAMFYKPPPGQTQPVAVRPIIGPGLPFDPPPAEIMPIDPEPWIEAVIPPEEEKRPPPQTPPIVVIEPVEKPPPILPPPPDISPPTIVPPEFEDPIPDPFPEPPAGIKPVVQPPASIMVIAGLEGVGTFMVYVGNRLVLTMAAALGTSLGKAAGAMLVGAVQKQLFRGTHIRFHTGNAYGNFTPGLTETRSVSYSEAWRMLPQEFAYWEK